MDKKGALEMSITSVVVSILSIAVIVAAVLLVQSLQIELPKIEKGMPQFFDAFIFPKEAQLGTVFRINIDFSDKSLVYLAEAQIREEGSDSVISHFPLYDDGSHGDKNANDGVYGNVFDSKGLDEGKYLLDLVVNPSDRQIKYQNISSFLLYKGNCVPLAYNGKSEDKVDVVFIPDGYTDMAKFKKDALKAIGIPSGYNGILTYEPFSSYSTNFNFYMLNQSPELGCQQGCQGVPSLVCCDNTKVAAAASQCPADQVIVIRDSSEFCGSASSYAKVCNGWNIGQVTTHEFGHIFGGLGDEYSYSKSYPGYKAITAAYPNCDVKSCPKWAAFWQGCVGGCGVSELFRPTQSDCLMYTYVDKFDNVDVKHLVNLLSNYQSQPENIAAPPKIELEDTYSIGLNYNNGKLSQKEVYVTQSKAPDRKAPRRTDYVAKIIAFDGKAISTFKFEFPRLEWPAMPRPEDRNNPELMTGPVVMSDANYTLFAPYSANASKMEIYDLQNNKVLTVDLAYLAKMCGDGICQEQESAVQCPADCRADVADDLCTYEKDGVCDPDCKKLDPDCGLKIEKSSLYIIAGAAITLIILVMIVLNTREKRK